MWRLADHVIAVLLPGTVLLYLSIAPYTKVEESFNLQAVHDFLHYRLTGTNLSTDIENHFDHVSFPGSVPRTFAGAVALAAVSYPFSLLVHGVHQQLLVRSVLGLFNAFCLLSYRNGLFMAYGRSTANWFLLLQASQFHVMYYASRTLPNMFAFGLTTIALRSFLSNQRKLGSARNSKRNGQDVRATAFTLDSANVGILILTATTVVFRSELALLLAPYVLLSLITGSSDLFSLILSGAIGFVAGLILTVPVDSLLWQRSLVWPELEGFLYNVYHGRSSDWGTSPATYYFFNALPKLLLNPMSYILTVPLALYTRTREALLAISPALLFILLYSFQPHKEWRFVVYVVPVLTGVAAIGAAWIWDRRAKSAVYRILALAMIASTTLSYLASLTATSISSFNYPGADALQRLHAIALIDFSKAQSMSSSVTGAQINIHMDTLSCTTGVTRFLQVQPAVLGIPAFRNVTFVYDKTEHSSALLDPVFWERFDYVLAERPERVIGAWEVVETVQGLAGVGLMSAENDEVAEDADENVFGGRPWSGPGVVLIRAWKQVEHWQRSLSGGRWIGLKLEHKIRILRKTRGGA